MLKLTFLFKGYVTATLNKMIKLVSCRNKASIFKVATKSKPLAESRKSILFELPTELLYEIFTFMRAEDVARCGRTCNLCYRISRDNTIWEKLYAKEFTDKYNARKQEKSNIVTEKELVTRWKVLYIDESENRWKEKRSKFEPKSQIIPGVVLVYNIFDCSAYQKYQCIKKFIKAFQMAQEKIVEISHYCKEFGIESLHINFVSKRKGWTWDETRELHFNVEDNVKTWAETLIQKDFRKILMAHRAFRDRILYKDSCFRTAAQILNVRYLSCTDESHGESIAFAQRVIENADKFKEFKSRDMLNLFLFVDKFYSGESDIKSMDQTYVNIPYSWSMDDMINFLRFDALKLERIIMNREHQKNESLKELINLKTQVKDLLNLNYLEVHFSLHNDQIKTCCERLLNLNEKIVFAIRREKFGFFIVERNFTQKLDKIVIPWDVTEKELEQILRYEHRYFMD